MARQHGDQQHEADQRGPADVPQRGPRRSWPGGTPGLSTAMPFRARGSSRPSRASTSLVTFSVSAPGNFSMTRNRLGPAPSGNRVADQRLVVLDHVSPRRPAAACRSPGPALRPAAAASISGRCAGRRGAGWPTRRSRRYPASTPPTNVSGETHSALPPAVSMSWVSVTCSARSFFGFTWTWSCRSRWP